jgi:hypothetical protein
VSMLGDDAQSCTSERTGESRRARCGRSDATPLPPPTVFGTTQFL